LLLLALFAVSLAAGADEPANLYAAATVAFTQPDGKELRIDSLKGRPAVVNFWATWCPPCREELPRLVKAHARHGKRVGFLGIAVEDKAEFVGEYARAYGLAYPVAVGREPAIALMQALGNSAAAMPYTVVVDGEGRVVYAKRGAVTERDLSQALAALARP
jgi:thiol-disulfide isomerase/thioredoxin